jgi:threonyl-tRNA synthetase
MSLLKITLPDGKEIEIEKNSTPFDIAKGISEGLARVAIAAKFNNNLIDLHKPLTEDGTIELITDKSPEAQDILRHSTAHLMAQAVRRIFPETKVTIGPVIEDGFYYDFDRDTPFTPEDLEKIEKEMKKITKEKLQITRKEISKGEGIKLFSDMNENYKVEIVEELPEGDTITIYTQGEFVDLCRGPHVPNTSFIKAFKLLSIAGAYWRGDENNKMLQRIYGTVFFKKSQLEEYLNMLEEAKKRDHRKLGKELDLFSFDEKVGGGLVFWHPKGAVIRKQIEDFMYKELIKRGYSFVISPHIAKNDLWKTSGHYDFYKENMYSLEIDEEEYIVKPMNCPFHVMIYKGKRRSYRELPIKYAENGTVYRYEKSGALHGMLRVRGFTQDDAHIICTPEQVHLEIEKLIDLALFVYKVFGFEKYKFELSVRDSKNKQKYAGTDEQWEMAEDSLIKALEKKGLDFERMEGEAVFYGPKIDVKLYDCIGRKWQATTIQFDFNLPARFNMNYIASDGQEHTPFMIHRAIFGSWERFFGMLVEQYAGAFPLWLAPVQVQIIPITDDNLTYANEIYDKLFDLGIRVEVDGRNEKMGYKIREAQLNKVPYMFIVGKKEAENNSVSVRKRGVGDIGAMALNEAVDKILQEIKDKVIE